MNPIFLRRILALDALSCAAMGLVMAPAAGSLAPLLGLPEGLIRSAGLLLIPLAGFIGWLASRIRPPRPGVWLVIAGNLAWSIESLLLVASKSATMTSVGIAFVAAQGAAVLALALLEIAGVRQLATRAA